MRLAGTGWMLCIALAAGCVAGAAHAASIPVSGAPGATLKSLAGTDTLVTVVLKEKEVQDPNLRIVDVHETHFNVLTQKGDTIPYLFDSVKEVRVQGGKVEKEPVKITNLRSLRPEDQQLLNDALKRAREIYAGSNDNQTRKIAAATILAANKDKDALAYLKELAAANDLRTAMDASYALYAAGENIEEKTVREGLRSGNRVIRIEASVLAGLTKYEDGAPALNRMAHDRIPEVVPAATVALARLGKREFIPDLIAALDERNERKGMAAVEALALLGGQELADQLKAALKRADGTEKYRIILVLHKLGDAGAVKMLHQLMQDAPTLSPLVANTLGYAQDFEGAQYLRKRLERREDPTDANLIARARTAAALVASGDPSAVTVFQQLLRGDKKNPKAAVFDLIVEIGNRHLLNVVQPSIINVDADVALGACETVAALNNAEYRKRLLDLRLGLPKPYDEN